MNKIGRYLRAIGLSALTVFGYVVGIIWMMILILIGLCGQPIDPNVKFTIGNRVFYVTGGITGMITIVAGVMALSDLTAEAWEEAMHSEDYPTED